uniref:Collagen alpha-1(I) chain-like n=1 Tax=Pogona vitticeps TaxID=103695 RepID=A0ABM5F2J7_9SAUR
MPGLSGSRRARWPGLAGDRSWRGGGGGGNFSPSRAGLGWAGPSRPPRGGEGEGRGEGGALLPPLKGPAGRGRCQRPGERAADPPAGRSGGRVSGHGPTARGGGRGGGGSCTTRAGPGALGGGRGSRAPPSAFRVQAAQGRQAAAGSPRLRRTARPALEASRSLAGPEAERLARFVPCRPASSDALKGFPTVPEKLAEKFPLDRPGFEPSAGPPAAAPERPLRDASKNGRLAESLAEIPQNCRPEDEPSNPRARQAGRQAGRRRRACAEGAGARGGSPFGPLAEPSLPPSLLPSPGRAAEPAARLRGALSRAKRPLSVCRVCVCVWLWRALPGPRPARGPSLSARSALAGSLSPPPEAPRGARCRSSYAAFASGRSKWGGREGAPPPQRFPSPCPAPLLPPTCWERALGRRAQSVRRLLRPPIETPEDLCIYIYIYIYIYIFGDAERDPPAHVVER